MKKEKVFLWPNTGDIKIDETVLVITGETTGGATGSGCITPGGGKINDEILI